MDTTVVSFNQMHFVGHVLGGEVAKDLPTDPNQVDLRFLRVISMGDTYDGDDSPFDGVAYRAVLYGNQIAWEQYADYVMGSCEQRSEKGNKFYRSLYHASMLYLKIQEVARELYFRKKPKKSEDTFYMSTSDLEVLKEHPQYKDMVRDFGLELRFTPKEHYLQVAVTKFYKKA
jgi:hypothetical protein